MIRHVITAIVAACFLSVGGSGATQMPRDESARDYSNVTSREMAEQLVAQGKLYKILLFPAEFGGEERPENIVYVPSGIPEIKDQLTGTLIRFLKDGLIDNLRVEPEYKGNSFVPARIRMFATHKTKTGSFNPVIEIW
jgi:hypothetical protein